MLSEQLISPCNHVLTPNQPTAGQRQEEKKLKGCPEHMTGWWLEKFCGSMAVREQSSALGCCRNLKKEILV